MFNTSSIALIVGGSSGMGKATAERLLKSGVPVMILSHDKQNLAEAKLHRVQRNKDLNCPVNSATMIDTSRWR